MKLVKYKHLSVNLKKKKRTRRRNKNIKTSINKSKCINCQKCFTKLQKLKNTQSETRPIKIRKRPGTRYCLGCKDFTHNFRFQEVKMTNKVLREKSNCVVSRSDKSRFFKQKRNKK